MFSSCIFMQCLSHLNFRPKLTSVFKLLFLASKLRQHAVLSPPLPSLLRRCLQLACAVATPPPHGSRPCPESVWFSHRLVRLWRSVSVVFSSAESKRSPTCFKNLARLMTWRQHKVVWFPCYWTDTYCWKSNISTTRNEAQDGAMCTQ